MNENIFRRHMNENIFRRHMTENIVRRTGFIFLFYLFIKRIFIQ